MSTKGPFQEGIGGSEHSKTISVGWNGQNAEPVHRVGEGKRHRQLSKWPVPTSAISREKPARRSTVRHWRTC